MHNNKKESEVLKGKLNPEVRLDEKYTDEVRNITIIGGGILIFKKVVF